MSARAKLRQLRDALASDKESNAELTPAEAELQRKRLDGDWRVTTAAASGGGGGEPSAPSPPLEIRLDITVSSDPECASAAAEECALSLADYVKAEAKQGNGTARLTTKVVQTNGKALLVISIGATAAGAPTRADFAMARAVDSALELWRAGEGTERSATVSTHGKEPRRRRSIPLV